MGSMINVERRKLGWWMWMWIEIELECGLVFGGLLFFDFGCFLFKLRYKEIEII